MYPYRRHNQRKRSRTGARRNKGGGRRLPGTARELMPLMQPATKALAQMLAGNTKASGQFVYARSMVERADQIVAEKQLERLTVRDREEFLEQLARLKLTVNDAEDEFGPIELDNEGDGEGAEDEDNEATGEEPAEEDAAPVDEAAEREAAEAERQRAEAEAEAQRERLKRIALALMAPAASTPEPVAAPEPAFAPFEPDEPAPAPRSASKAKKADTRAAASPRRPRITLRSKARDAEPAEQDERGVASEG